ncbi:hypothetical protein KVR01_002583 [Diaporthe batatas]|uniref:uncharacterized protein n=1 Tax=Diaporthe batatas TaxID=748121 RepID=UPI001D03B391|nr:uncharacterized protein KVR01_002583 [Diaporthe batatas]KAG8166894.1 hypothetical protein KVR01_002583 [Diaporthe batatas]
MLVPWDTEINFASALLLHSCVTVVLKEAFNVIEIARRLVLRRWTVQSLKGGENRQDRIGTSIVLDGYTSIFSHDLDGDLAELYFTNTGLGLLAVSLASSVAMNLFLPGLVLNAVVAATFAVAFLASLVNGKKGLLLPILALRRAGRFIWSDTPFVNFFSVIYIATVLRGQSTLRLQDYVTFRSIAVLELVFMKGRLAASSPEQQIALVRRLVASEWVAVNANRGNQYLDRVYPSAERDDMVTFTTLQRLWVMLFKTSISYHCGCLKGSLGPATVPLPDLGFYADGPSKDWKIYRVSEDVMILADCLDTSTPKNQWGRFISSAHGVLLRRLGKVRVIYLLRLKTSAETGCISLWHSNINLVTGVSKQWLLDEFDRSQPQGICVVAGK